MFYVFILTLRIKNFASSFQRAFRVCFPAGAFWEAQHFYPIRNFYLGDPL